MTTHTTGTTQPEPSPSATSSRRVLRRNPDDKVIAGVCSGLGRYFGIDPILMRLLFVILALAGGTAILAYIALWIVIPEQRAGDDVGEFTGDHLSFDAHRGWRIIGIVMVAAGALALTRQLLPGLDEVVWPLILAAVGIALIMNGGRPR